MSKKILFMGGAALLLVTFLVLIGCPDATSPAPNPPSKVASVALDIDTVIVTFTDSITNIETAMKAAGHLTATANYTVAKNTEAAMKVTTITPRPDGKSVTIAVSGVHSGLTTADTINVEVKNVGKGTFKPEPLQVSRVDTETEGTKFTVTFNQELYSAEKKLAVGTDYATSFKITDAAVGTEALNLSSVKVDTNGAIIILEFANLDDNDTLGPADAGTVTSVTGLPWTGMLTYDGTNKVWSITTP
ncbi:hypothetical protein LQZ21_12595 [Treponema sp. TIM-1]|uniref:hypothetical protein n=1 Tax=Treponema sp. TIM-1 TaxID=2898417 RepID=UPI003980E5D7